MQITPYLHFDGKCAEALEFYKSKLGAKIEFMMKFKETPGGPDPKMVTPQMMDQVMHASFKLGDSVVFASDCGKPMSGFSLTLSLKTAEEVDRLFKVIADGGETFQQPSETFFSKRFAIANDRYGVNWILLVPSDMNENANREKGSLASV
jgi:PhnB protein